VNIFKKRVIFKECGARNQKRKSLDNQKKKNTTKQPMEARMTKRLQKDLEAM